MESEYTLLARKEASNGLQERWGGAVHVRGLRR